LGTSSRRNEKLTLISDPSGAFPASASDFFGSEGVSNSFFAPMPFPPIRVPQISSSATPFGPFTTFFAPLSWLNKAELSICATSNMAPARFAANVFEYSAKVIDLSSGSGTGAAAASPSLAAGDSPSGDAGVLSPAKADFTWSASEPQL